MPAILGITGKGHRAFKGRHRHVGICSFQESLSEQVVPAPEVTREFGKCWRPLAFLASNPLMVFLLGHKLLMSDTNPEKKNLRCLLEKTDLDHLGLDNYQLEISATVVGTSGLVTIVSQLLIRQLLKGIFFWLFSTN